VKKKLTPPGIIMTLKKIFNSYDILKKGCIIHWLIIYFFLRPY